MNEYIKIFILVLVGIYGLCVGSFLNVVVYRLPAGIKMTNDRSHCPDCKALIHWYDNIPLFSYLILGGRCRNCKKRISPRYPVVEALNALLWLLSFIIFSDNMVYAGICSVVLSCLICVFIIDLEHMIIYDRFHVIIGGAAVASIFFDRFAPWYSHLIGAVAGAGVFFLVGFLISKKVGADALGMGDVKLLFVMGLFLGWEKLIPAILVGSITAAVAILISQRKNGYDSRHEYPFGPYLSLGFALSMLFGNWAISGYLSLFA